MDTITFPALLARSMDDAGDSRTDLASAVGYSEAAVRAWLEGRSHSRVPTLARIARRYGWTDAEIAAVVRSTDERGAA